MTFPKELRLRCEIAISLKWACAITMFAWFALYVGQSLAFCFEEFDLKSLRGKGRDIILLGIGVGILTLIEAHIVSQIFRDVLFLFF